MRAVPAFALLVLASCTSESPPPPPALPGEGLTSATVTACQPCHQEIVDRYVQTAHFATSAVADSGTIHGNFSEGHNRLTTGTSGVYFVMTRLEDGFYQTGVDEKRGMITQRMDVVVGSGRRGQSFLYWRDRLLFQLPVSYLTRADQWINSPGYPDGQVDFGRVIVPRCLECHATAFRVEAENDLAVYASEHQLGLTCTKCHGDGTRHVEAVDPSGALTGEAYILNPGRFSRERRIDNCALCHGGNPPLKGLPFSYRPGQDLSEYLTSPADSAAVPDVHGNQVGLLQRSRCFQASPEMTCATCHNVHEPQRDLVAQAQNCLGCHQVAAHPDAAQIGDRMISRCVDCHMPETRSSALQLNNATSQDAFSFRNHQIGRYPEVVAEILGSGRRP